MKKNADIRMMIDLYGLKHKAIAEHMGFSRQYFSQLLNSDLSAEVADRIKQAIREVANHG